MFGANFLYLIMRKTAILLALIQFALLARSQDIAEFEGHVYYTNHFVIKGPGADSNQLKEFFGVTNTYTYKQGNYLWTFDNSAVELELYRHENAQLLYKYKNRKYYISRDIAHETDSLISYTITENADTICGYICNSIRIVTGWPGRENKLIRTLYYNKDLAVDPSNFKNYRGYAHWKVYQITKAIPLRIVIDDGVSPFAIVMEAVKVERTPVSDKVFKQDKSLSVKAEKDL
jgi:hypothetical protein